MPLVHNNSFPFTLDVLRASLQHANQTHLFLPLSLNANNLPRLNGMLCIRQSPAGGRQPGSHERSAGEHEANGTAVDLQGRDRGGEFVHEFEVWDGRAVEGLEEEGGRVYRVEGCALGSVLGWVVRLVFC